MGGQNFRTFFTFTCLFCTSKKCHTQTDVLSLCPYKYAHPFGHSVRVVFTFANLIWFLLLPKIPSLPSSTKRESESVTHSVGSLVNNEVKLVCQKQPHWPKYSMAKQIPLAIESNELKKSYHSIHPSPLTLILDPYTPHSTSTQIHQHGHPHQQLHQH